MTWPAGLIAIHATNEPVERKYMDDSAPMWKEYDAGPTVYSAEYADGHREKLTKERFEEIRCDASV